MPPRRPGRRRREPCATHAHGAPCICDHEARDRALPAPTGLYSVATDGTASKMPFLTGIASISAPSPLVVRKPEPRVPDDPIQLRVKKGPRDWPHAFIEANLRLPAAPSPGLASAVPGLRGTGLGAGTTVERPLKAVPRRLGQAPQLRLPVRRYLGPRPLGQVGHSSAAAPSCSASVLHRLELWARAVDWRSEMDEHIVWLQPHRNAPWHGLVLPGHVRSALDVMQRLVRDRWTMEVSSGIVDHEVVQYERRLATARRLLGSEPTPDSDATPSTESTSPASSDQRPATTSPTASSTESKTPEALSPPATTSPATAASPGSSSDAVTVLPPPPPPIVLILLQLDMVPPEECSWCSSNVTGPMGDDLCHALWIPGHDVIPALICEDCAALRWQVLSHDRHERFLPLRDMAGSPVKRTATCSICKGTAESKCSLCALLVCSGCESLLLSMFDGQLDHLMAAKGLEGLRNDACLLFSNDFVLALLKEAAVEECEWHFRDADQSI